MNCARFSTRFGPTFSKNFRGRKIYGPKSREIVPKFVLPDDARPSREATRSAKSPASIAMPLRDDLRAFFDAIRTDIFEKFSRPQNLWSEIA